MCAKTDEEARARADGDTFFQFSLRFYGQSSDRRRPPAGTVNMWEEYQKWKAANPEAHAAALRGGLIGSPDTIRRKLRKFEESNIDQVILLNQAGKNTHEHICESLELFAKEVMPEFQGAHPELLKWKERVLNREIELEEIDTSAFTDRYGGTMKAIAPAKAQSGGISSLRRTWPDSMFSALPAQARRPWGRPSPTGSDIPMSTPTASSGCRPTRLSRRGGQGTSGRPCCFGCFPWRGNGCSRGRRRNGQGRSNHPTTLSSSCGWTRPCAWSGCASAKRPGTASVSNRAATWLSPAPNFSNGQRPTIPPVPSSAA